MTNLAKVTRDARALIIQLRIELGNGDQNSGRRLLGACAIYVSLLGRRTCQDSESASDKMLAIVRRAEKKRGLPSLPRKDLGFMCRV
ncbi:hypothetical protein CL634_09060 [bacterium]|nr:hypothetical protein [bacterium]